MKIALVTKDEKSISAHFGRASHYSIFEILDGKIVAKEIIEKQSQHEQRVKLKHVVHRRHQDRETRGTGKHARERHKKMFAPIADCEVVIARGMGKGTHLGLVEMGIKPILTDIVEIETAVKAVIDDTIKDHPERVH